MPVPLTTSSAGRAESVAPDGGGGVGTGVGVGVGVGVVGGGGTGAPTGVDVRHLRVGAVHPLRGRAAAVVLLPAAAGGRRRAPRPRCRRPPFSVVERGLVTFCNSN